MPLRLPAEVLAPTIELAAAPAVPANLTYRGGPLLTKVEVVTIFWGATWAKARADLAKELNGFFDWVLTSALIDQLGEYGVPGKKIGHGRRTATVTVASPAPFAAATDKSIRSFLSHQIATNPGIPKPGGNSLHFVFLPPGVAVVAGGSRSCQAFCGYHDAVGSDLFYAVMPYPGCGGCRGPLVILDALTTTSSHELCEAITDPVPGEGWYDDANGEIGDICAWQTKKLGAYTVQLEWSNAKKRCV